MADENIPFAEEAFSQFGKVSRFSGRSVTSKELKKADILIVRSVTKVSQSLLQPTNIRFVGTATIGIDHIDIDYLHKSNIAFASAAGCNSNSVSEYITAALIEYTILKDCEPADLTLGIIGYGNVGKKVYQKACTLGIKCLVNDPPLYHKSKDNFFIDISELQEKADIITLHVPLQNEGIYKTSYMINEIFLNKLKKNILLINTSRGGVVEESILKKFIENRKIDKFIFDVWENEPAINTNLLSQSLIGTPHIAGYSLNGKINGTTIIQKALASYLKQEAEWSYIVSDSDICTCEFIKDSNFITSLKKIISKTYNLINDSERFKDQINRAADIAVVFDNYRKNYPVRWEFPHLKLKLHNFNSREADKIKNLGFRILK